MKYLRQEALKEIGLEGQKKIRNSKIAIIGMGALGTVSSELLTRTGIGELLLVDKDTITEINLHRQFLYTEKDIGKLKTETAQKKLNKINKDTKIKIYNEYLDKNNWNILKKYNLILDCTDNMASRFIINEYCKKNKKKWIHAGVSGLNGNVLVITKPEIFKKIIKTGETFNDCSEIGVLNMITSMVSSIQVMEAIKIILNKKHTQGLIRINPWNSEYNIYKLKQTKTKIQN